MEKRDWALGFTLIFALLAAGFGYSELGAEPAEVTFDGEVTVPTDAFVEKVVTETVEVEVPGDFVLVDGHEYTAESVKNLLEVTEDDSFNWHFSTLIWDALAFAEDDADLEYDGEIYEGDDGEFEIEDVESEDCEIRLSSDWDEGKIVCEDVEIETDDHDNIECVVVVEYDGGDFDDADIDRCE